MTSGLVLLETLYYSALTPLLPNLKASLSLSTSQAGVLTAIYALGAMASAVPAALLAGRAGVKTVASGGAVMLAIGSAAFGLARSYETLMAFRLLQGIGGVSCLIGSMAWLLAAVPAERRGLLTGIAFSAMAAGSVMGPLLGAASAAAGRAPVFGASAAITLLLAFTASRFPAPAATEGRSPHLGAALTSGRVRTAMWLATIPSVMLGAISALAPLQLRRLGAGTAEIGVTFALSAAVGSLVRPFVGRWSDRGGRVLPIRVGLTLSIVFVLLIPSLGNRWAVSVSIVLAVLAAGVYLVPAIAFLSDTCAVLSLGQLAAATIMNLAWPPGFALGSGLGGFVADTTSQRVAYGALAVLLCATLISLTRVTSDRP
jgi:MFS family permease